MKMFNTLELLNKLQFDDNDPVGRAYLRYGSNIRMACVLVIVVLALLVVVGLPHIRTSQRHNGTEAGAYYLSITGKQFVTSGQHGQRGLPVLIFIPIYSCFS